MARDAIVLPLAMEAQEAQAPGLGLSAPKCESCFGCCRGLQWAFVESLDPTVRELGQVLYRSRRELGCPPTRSSRF